MGVLIEGRWTEQDLPQEIAPSGEFKRIESRFRDRITADGSSGFKAQAGRYHLYLAHSCPWAHRVLIFLVLKKLEGAISTAFAIPGRRDEGWTYEDDPAYPEAVKKAGLPTAFIDFGDQATAMAAAEGTLELAAKYEALLTGK